MTTRNIQVGDLFECIFSGPDGKINTHYLMVIDDPSHPNKFVLKFSATSVRFITLTSYYLTHHCDLISFLS